MKFNFRGKRYRIKTDALIAVCLGILTLLIFAVVLVMRNISAPEEEGPQATPEPTAEAEPYDASAGVLDKKEYDGTVLEETKDAGESYVESTLFLGDSNTARFLAVINSDTKKTFTSKTNTIGVVGMGIDAIAAFPCMDFSSGRYSMPQSVAILQPERVIITMGTNNLYGSSTETDSFIERYEKGIQAVETAYPSVDIIVNAIPPVSKNTTYTNVKMVQIDAYNKAIAKMCKDNDWKFLDSSEALKDDKTGYAKEGYMISDGLHLSEKGLRALFEYIRTHSHITDDDRPKPLAAIPNVIGVPDGLFKTDPLTNEEYTEDPLTAETEWVPEDMPLPEVTEEPQETEEPEETAEPTATPETTPTPDPALAERQNACINTFGKWTENGCACLSGYQLNAQTGNCEAVPASASPDAAAPAETAVPAESAAPAPTETPVPTEAPAPTEVPVPTEPPVQTEVPAQPETPAEPEAAAPEEVPEQTQPEMQSQPEVPAATDAPAAEPATESQPADNAG